MEDRGRRVRSVLALVLLALAVLAILYVAQQATRELLDPEPAAAAAVAAG